MCSKSMQIDYQPIPTYVAILDSRILSAALYIHMVCTELLIWKFIATLYF